MPLFRVKTITFVFFFLSPRRAVEERELGNSAATHRMDDRVQRTVAFRIVRKGDFMVISARFEQHVEIETVKGVSVTRARRDRLFIDTLRNVITNSRGKGEHTNSALLSMVDTLAVDMRHLVTKRLGYIHCNLLVAERKTRNVVSI
ncbi:hypothetical protein TNCV_4822501 [Trichonephila clavipes]|nr:hypothetical protein TNCV_4822501 [Trichonephila clavipes]